MITSIEQAVAVTQRRFQRLGAHRTYVHFALPAGQDKDGNAMEHHVRMAVPHGREAADVVAAILQVYPAARIVRTERVRRRDLPKAVRRFLWRSGLGAGVVWAAMQRAAA